jgi:hypothetical protein
MPSSRFLGLILSSLPHLRHSLQMSHLDYCKGSFRSVRYPTKAIETLRKSVGRARSGCLTLGVAFSASESPTWTGTFSCNRSSIEHSRRNTAPDFCSGKGQRVKYSG